MYYLAVEIEDGELLVWEHLSAEQMINLRNLYIDIAANHMVRSGKMPI